MSLETLLEAAEFIELRSKGDDSPATTFHPYARAPTNSSESEESNQTAKTGDFDEENGQEKRRSGGAGTREVHNKLEKNRRAHLKECFDFLKKNIPSLEDKRSSNLGILLGSLRYIQTLKRKEREYEADMQRLAQEKIRLQMRIDGLKHELARMNIEVDLNAWVRAQDFDNETNSTSTATERGTPPPSDMDDDEDDLDDDLMMDTKSPKSPKKPKSIPVGVSKPAVKGQTVTPVGPRMAIHDVRSIKELLFNGAQPKLMESFQGLVASKSVVSQHPAPIHPSSQQSVVKQEFPVMVNSMRMPNNVPAASGVIVRAPTSALANIMPVARGNVSTLASTAPQTTPHPRTPVTQILHQTLTQRQARLKQSAVSSTVSSAPITAARLKSPPQAMPHIPATTVGMPVTSSPTKLTASENSASTNSTITSMAGSSVVPPKLPHDGAPTTNPMSFPFSINMSAFQKGFTHPILVTSLTAPSVAMTTAGIPQTCSVTTSVTDLKSSSVNSAKSGASVTQSAVSSSVPSSPLAAYSVRPYFPSNLLSTGFTLPLLAAQTIPQTTAMFPSTTTGAMTSTALTTAGAQVTSVPIMSLAQVNHLSPLISPITVMSGMQMAASGLNQAQLNGMLTSQYFKQFQHIPIIPQSLIRPGAVVGQQVVKPVVMVTMPGLATTASSALTTTVTSVTSS